MYTTPIQHHLTTPSQASVVDYDIEEKTIGEVPETDAIAAWVCAVNAAADVGDDFSPARCDAREGGLIVLE